MSRMFFESLYFLLSRMFFESLYFLLSRMFLSRELVRMNPPFVVTFVLSRWLCVESLALLNRWGLSRESSQQMSRESATT